MTFTPKDIKHLELMAQLNNKESTPVKHPEIEPLFEQDEMRQSTDEKILSLCVKLRREGFNRQADNLENKFINYKSASTHLYRVFDEDGEDLIDAAHPDGEVKVEDASDWLGNVETILTEHKRNVEMVSKNPSGKLASVNLHKYVDQCESILTKQATGFWDVLGPVGMAGSAVYDFWQNFKATMGDIADSAEILKQSLDSLVNHSEATKFADLSELANNIIPKLDQVIEENEARKIFEIEPKTHATELSKSRELFETLSTQVGLFISKLDRSLKIYREQQNAGETLIRGVQLFVNTSIGDKALHNAKSFKVKLSKAIGFIKTLEASTKSEQPVVNNKSNEMIIQLNEYKTKLNQRNDLDNDTKISVNTWLDAQIKDVMDNANNSQKLEELAKENEEFKQAWNL